MRWLLVALVASSCASSSRLKVAFLAKEQLAFDKEKYQDDAAVVLHRADRTLLQTNPGATELMRHAAIAILKEGGFDLADVKIPFSARQELVTLIARVVQPDGSVREVEARDILSDTNAKGERDTKAKFFRFPDVQVGSVLEYAYVVKAPWIVGYDDQDTLGEFPVRHYDFELTGSRLLPLEAVEYNSTRPIEVTTLNDGSNRLRFSLDDLPPRPKEEWAPNWTFTEPRWAWRVLGYKESTQITTDWFRNWQDVVERVARDAWIEPAPFAGFSAWPDLSACADAACKVTKATEWIQEKTSTLHVDTNRQLPLAEAFTSGHASAKERALLLRAALGRAGVEAQLLYTTELASRQTRRSFPELEQFNRLLVWIPAQPSIPRPLPIDLEEEYCRPGQLPLAVNKQPGFVFWMMGGVVGQGEAQGEWITLDAEPCLAPLERDTHQAMLLDDGTLVDVVEVKTEGDTSESWQLGQRDWTAREFRKEIVGRALSVSRLASPSDWKWRTCDRRLGRCDLTFTVTAPRFAVKDGRSWVVPLSVLTSFFASTFNEEQRTQAVHLAAERGVVEETLELDVPKGFHPVTLPDVVMDATPGVSVRMVAERSPRGVRITRRLAFSPGIYDQAQYPKLRAVLEKFQSYRKTVLQFDPD